jgi:hypothetical protein
MGVPVPIQRVNSMTFTPPRPEVSPPGVQQVLDRTIPPGSQIPGPTGPHVAPPTARDYGQSGEQRQLTSATAAAAHHTVLNASEHGTAQSIPTSNTQVHSDVQVPVPANATDAGPSELSPSSRIHDVIHEGEYYSCTEPNSSGVTGKAVADKQVQGRNNSHVAGAATSAEAAALQNVAGNEVNDQAMNQTAHEGTARKRPKRITLSGDELEGSIQLQFSPHDKHGMPLPTEMVVRMQKSPSKKNHLARTTSESSETTTPIRPKKHGRKKRPATYTEGEIPLPPPQHRYVAAQGSFQGEQSPPQLERVPSSSETRDLKLHDKDYIVTSGVEEEVFCHATAEVGEHKQHAPTWVDEEESTLHQDHDDAVPTNGHAAKVGTGTRGRKQGKKVTKKGDQNTQKAKKSSKTLHKGRKKQSRDRGITRIDDVAPEESPHTPVKKSTTTGSEAPQEPSTVERHSGDNEDVDHKITWVDEDEPVSGAAGQTKQQQQQQQQHQPPVPCGTFNPATVTAEGVFEGRVVNNPLFTPQPQQLSDHTSAEVERVKPLQDAQQQNTTVRINTKAMKSSKNREPQLPLVHDEKVGRDGRVPGSETIEGSTKFGQRCPLLSCLLCSKQDHGGLAFHSSMDSIEVTPDITTIPAEMSKKDVVIPPPVAATITPPQSSSQQHIPAAFGGRAVTNPIFSPQETALAAPVYNVVPPTQPANYYPPALATNAVPLYNPQTPATQPVNYYQQTPAINVVSLYGPQPQPADYYPPTQYYSPAPPQVIVSNALQANNQRTTAATLEHVGTNKVVGYTPPKLRKRQKEAREAIFKNMRVELAKPNSHHGEEYKDTCCCQCTDTCFQAITCSPPSVTYSVEGRPLCHLPKKNNCYQQKHYAKVEQKA